MRRTPKELVRELVSAKVSRREFVERVAGGTMGLAATMAALSAASEAQNAKASQPHGHAPAHTSPSNGSMGDTHDFNQTNAEPWDTFLEQENLPVIRDYYVTNLRAVELKPWKRLGGTGAHIDLVGGEGVNCAYLLELAPGEKSNPQRYLFEEVLYVLSGEGETQMWQPGNGKVTVKWKAGSVIGPPLNMWRQHFNTGKTPARFLSVNNAPVVVDLFHNADFIFNDDFVFRDRWDGNAAFFQPSEDNLHLKKSESTEQKGGVFTWESGFVPNARTLGLKTSLERGAGNSRIELQLASNTMQAHISEFAVGTYKKAHRHGPGSHVVMLNGTGYTLMWKGSLKYSDAPENQKLRVDFIEGSLFVPPDGWFHQHFNTGNDPARYLAPTWGGDGKWFMRALGGGGRTHRLGKTSTRKGGNLIEYEDEDPQVREIYLAELKKNGIDFKMKPRKSEEAQ